MTTDDPIRRLDLDTAPFADLTTTGRSRLPRTIEMWFAARAGAVYLLAGDGERAHWVRNIVADPSVRFRIGDQDFIGRGRNLYLVDRLAGLVIVLKVARRSESTYRRVDP